MIDTNRLKIFSGTSKIIKEMRQYKYGNNSAKHKSLDEVDRLLYKALRCSQWWKEL